MNQRYLPPSSQNAPGWLTGGPSAARPAITATSRSIGKREGLPRKTGEEDDAQPGTDFPGCAPEEVRMYQAPFPPGSECSTSQEVEPATREKVRTISPEDQEALEQAPFFDALCQMYDRWARLARRESERKWPESNRPVA